MATSPPLVDDDGYMAILAALAILVLVSIASITASRIAGTEVTMAGNETVTQRNFYLAEGAVMEAVDLLDNTADIRSADIKWLERAAGKLDNATVKNYWKLKDDPYAAVAPSVSAADPGGRTLFIAADEGVAQGASMMMGRTTVHEFSLYGRCAWRGVSVVKMGYRAAY
jgi:hypothetical protein